LPKDFQALALDVRCVRRARARQPHKSRATRRFR